MPVTISHRLNVPQIRESPTPYPSFYHRLWCPYGIPAGGAAAPVEGSGAAEAEPISGPLSGDAD
jgi:hypothetical protein